MDWATGRVLSWRLSNTLEVEFRIKALKDAMAPHSCPEIFNTDQGSQFTSPRFTKILRTAKVKISMGAGGRWIDNVMIKRLWRSLKYECVYLNAFETGSEAPGRDRRLDRLSQYRAPALGARGRTPVEAHEGLGLEAAA